MGITPWEKAKLSEFGKNRFAMEKAIRMRGLAIRTGGLAIRMDGRKRMVFMRKMVKKKEKE